MGLYTCVIGICIYILTLNISLLEALTCYSEQANDYAKVDCSVSFYKEENCSETYLSEIYTDLYQKEYFPGRPSNLVLKPIQKYLVEYKKYYSGFIAAIQPPRTSDIKDVRGFQLDFRDHTGSNRCLVIQIPSNTRLNATHRDNNLTLNTEVFPLYGHKNYTFTAYSLPTPRVGEKKEVQEKYGESWDSGWSLNFPSSTWSTTISYYLDTEDKQNKCILFTFVKAPPELNFIQYEVTLSKLLGNIGQPDEVREYTGPFLIMQTDYMFCTLQPGKYRVEVSPYDDQFNNSNCKCNKGNNMCTSCMKTVTAVIEIRNDNSIPGNNNPISSPTATNNPSGQLPSSFETDTNGNSSAGKNSNNKDESVLPSVLGVLAFFIIVIISVGCFILNKNRLQLMFEEKSLPKQGLNNNRPSMISSNVPLKLKRSNNCFLHPEYILTEKRVAIISADDNENHQKVVSAFASFLQKRCHCNVDYFPWTSDDKFRWIANTVENAEYHIFVASESAMDQYDAWKRKKLTTSKDLFVFYLSKVLNRSVANPNLSNKFILVKFDHSSDVAMPDELCSSQYTLMKHFSGFLSHIHGLNPYKDDLKKIDLPFDDVGKTKEGKELNAAIHHAIKMFRPKQSRLDSGYKSHNENNSFDEQEWREVRQKYILNAILQEQPKAEVYGAFVIDDESRSLMPGQTTEVASLVPALTIAEGGAGERACIVQQCDLTAIQPIHNPLIAVNKYGNQMAPNIYPCKEEIQRKQSSSTNGSEIKQHEIEFSSKQRNNPEEGFTDGTNGSYFFIPPEPSLVDEDITTLFQCEMMHNINKQYLKKPEADMDDISGYSV